MMRRGDRGSIARAPRTERDGAIPSGVQAGRRVRGGCGMVMVVAGCSLVTLLTIFWSLRRPPEPPHGVNFGHTPRQSRDDAGFLFPLYRYQRQLHPEVGLIHGRRIRSEKQGLFGLHGGRRLSDDGLKIGSFYIKMEVGIGVIPFHFHIDTASGPLSWVYCNDRSRPRSSLKVWGPNGRFMPRDYSVKCIGPTASACRTLQDHGKQLLDCDKRHHFDCLFALDYFDGSIYRGRVVNESITLPMIDKTKRKIFALIGCATENKGDSVAFKPLVTDGVIALGPCKGTLMDQLWTGKHISRNIVGVCVAKDSTVAGAAPVGFISLGMHFEEQFGNSVSNWAKLVTSVSSYCANAARLLHIFVDQKRIAVQSLPTAMYFDTAADLTYLRGDLHALVLKALDTHATDRAYVKKDDNLYRRENLQRMCWEPPSKNRKTHETSMPESSPYDDFESLVLGFEGVDGNTKYLLIQPVNYLVWNKEENKLCVNILQDPDYSVSNLGADILRGYLFVFDNENKRVRWTTSDNCATI